MKIRIRRVNPADKFTMLPNDFLRFGGCTRLSLRARAMLAALVSYSDDWEITRETLRRIAQDLGEDAIDTVRDELKTKQHLRIERDRLPDGKFVWTWYVSIEPFSPATPSVDNPPMDSPAKTEFPQVAPSVDNPPMDNPPILEDQVLEEQREENQPTKLVAQPTGGDRQGSEVGWMDESKTILKTASAGLNGRTPQGSMAHALVAAVAGARSRGWPAWRITQLLAGDLTGVKDVGKVWLTRIKTDLSGIPTATEHSSPETADPELMRVRAESVARREEQLARQAARRREHEEWQARRKLPLLEAA